MTSAPSWTLPQVERAAPDAAALAAGRRLATPGPWSETGATETLVWGRCQGSGKTPYQVSVDLAGPAYRCSCPSRKFPCKHALALLLLWVGRRGPFAAEGTDQVADFAREWAEQRASRAAGAAQAEAAAATRAPKDPAAALRRREERLALMTAGMADFGLWLEDLVRAGLVSARRQPFAWWDTAAARLVDAQLPGPATEVRDLGSLVQRRPDWADELLTAMGRWWTAVQVWPRRDSLDERTWADLRTYLGWAMPTEEVRAADSVTDAWLVLGVHRSDDGRLQQQRTWLRAQSTGEVVQVLDFAVRGVPLPVATLTGAVLQGTLARYPGSSPRRALVVDLHGVDEPATSPTALAEGTDLAGALGALADTWALNPWASRVPVVLEHAVLVPTSKASPGAVVDASGAALPLLLDTVETSVWPMFARCGGRPGAVFGELEQTGFRPLTLDLDLVPGLER